MKFSPVPVEDAEGKILGHNIAGLDGRRLLTKWKSLTLEDVQRLHQLGRKKVYVAELEPGDVDENQAALTIAESVRGANIVLSRPSAGRVNLIASVRGVLRVDAVQVYELNRFDGITLATLPADRFLRQKQMVATVKIIPYAVPGVQLRQAAGMLASDNKLAANTSPVPRYAFFRNVAANLGGRAPWTFDADRGMAVFPSGRVFAVSKLKGMPLKAEEVAILLRPGESASLEIFLPHRPIPVERAVRLSERSFDEALTAARRYWKEKLDSAAQIDLPEERMTEMIRAGLLHLDLIHYGLEPDGTLVPAIGIYTAIGSESSPIIQFMDSMGWHKVARRAAMFINLCDTLCPLCLYG